MMKIKATVSGIVRAGSGAVVLHLEGPGNYLPDSPRICQDVQIEVDKLSMEEAKRYLGREVLIAISVELGKEE